MNVGGGTVNLLYVHTMLNFAECKLSTDFSTALTAVGMTCILFTVFKLMISKFKDLMIVVIARNEVTKQSTVRRRFCFAQVGRLAFIFDVAKDATPNGECILPSRPVFYQATHS
jgi:hypothetical protein